jgi:3-hydroxybutyrate dehydrogenase
VKTPLVEAQIAALARTHHLTEQQVVEEIMLKPMPKRQFITLEELIGSVEFLLSPAARNITGQCLVLDGGWTAQ